MWLIAVAMRSQLLNNKGLMMKRKHRPLEVKKVADNKTTIEVPFEVKQIIDDDDEFFYFEGLASTFGNVDLVSDVMEPGSFRESLTVKTPIVLWQHMSSEPIGMPEEIREVPEGLFIKAKLPKSDSLVNGRVIPQIKVGSVRKMSIGFRTISAEPDMEDPRVRRIKKVDLVEVSLVTFPANPEASVTGFKNLEGEEQDPLTDEEIKLIMDFREGKSIGAGSGDSPITVD